VSTFLDRRRDAFVEASVVRGVIGAAGAVR